MAVYLIVKNKKIWHEGLNGNRDTWDEDIPIVLTFEAYNKFYEVVEKLMLAKEVFKAYSATEYKVTATVKIKIE